MKKKVNIDREKCKGCMLCVAVCPRKMIKKAAEVNKKGLQFVVAEDPDECTGCGLCVLMCPDCAIEIVEKETT